MYANLLAKELEAGGWNAEAQDLGEYPSERLKEEDFVVFVASCFGKGEPPDSARKLWAYLHDHQRDDEGAPLKSLNYAIFGLGNSACASLWGGALTLARHVAIVFCPLLPLHRLTLSSSSSSLSCARPEPPLFPSFCNSTLIYFCQRLLILFVPRCVPGCEPRT